MKNGRALEPEDTEKDSASSKRNRVKSDSSQDFTPFFASLLAEAYGLKNRGHRGESKKFLAL
jgi:hypothetical protein